MKWRLLLRPEAVAHFTSKHPVTKEELEGILDKPRYVKRISKNRYKLLGRGRSGRYLTIILETGIYSMRSLLLGRAKRTRRIYIEKSRSDIDGKS